MKKVIITWALVMILWMVPWAWAAKTEADERTYPVPVTETEEVVTGWLQKHGFQIYRVAPTRQRVVLVAEKLNARWRIILKPHSPLATLIRTEVRLDHDRSQLDAFRRFLDGYIHLPSSRPNLLAPAIPMIVRQHLKAVVCIFAQDNHKEIQFTGFVIDTKGVIVSTAHDLEPHQNISVLLHDGREVNGQVVKIDPHRDLTLVKVAAVLETAIPLNNGRYLLSSGDPLFALTCPNSGIAGIQSGALDGLPRRVEGLPLWKVRMDIDPGSSGSPVFDDQGRLAAVVMGRYRGTDTVGFLIAFETLVHFLEKH